MFKLFLTLTVLVFAGSVFSQSKDQVPRQLTEREKKILEIKHKVDPEMVMGILRKYNNDIAFGIKNQKPLTAMQYYGFAAAIEKEWLKRSWFEADTGLNVNWLKKIHKLMLHMGKNQKYLETAKPDDKIKSPEYNKAVEALKTAQEEFTGLINNPVRVPAKIQEKKKKEKITWQKAMRKKYNITN